MNVRFLVSLRLVFLLTFGIGLPLVSSAQLSENEDDSDFRAIWFGYVKNDFFYDTRQSYSAREGHLMLYPKEAQLDAEGNDIHTRGQFNFLSIQSRFGTKLIGPKAFGAEVSGLLEGAYFGHTESDVNGFRLRHAYLELDWGKWSLLMGQFWHLLFVPEVFPGTISFNTGIPFQFFSRNPQIRVSYQQNSFQLIAAAASQRDFPGPGGYQGLSNSLLPDLHFQAQWKVSEQLLLASTFGYKRTLPRLVSLNNYKTNESFGAFNLNSFARYRHSKSLFKVQALWAQNAYDGLMLGGYTVASMVDMEREIRSYVPINTFSIWGEWEHTYRWGSSGLFLAYSKNMGSFELLENPEFLGAFSRGANVDYLYRMAPRVSWNSGKIRLAVEVEYTVAAYATSQEDNLLNRDAYGRISDSYQVGVWRFLLGSYYFF